MSINCLRVEGETETFVTKAEWEEHRFSSIGIGDYREKLRRLLVDLLSGNQIRIDVGYKYKKDNTKKRQYEAKFSRNSLFFI